MWGREELAEASTAVSNQVFGDDERQGKGSPSPLAPCPARPALPLWEAG